MKKSVIAIVLVLVLSLAGMVAALVGIHSGVEDLAVEINQNQVDAVLASANVENNSAVSVPVLYYEQSADTCVDLYDQNLNALVEARQFEWTNCGYYKKAIESEMTEPVLDDEFLPVARGGQLLTNRGVNGGNFARWFHQVDGKSRSVASNINLSYDAKTASFVYENNNFYPVVPGGLFTMNLGVPFEITHEGKESFEITADDDTWVYVNDKIVLDMGGIHNAVSGKFKINEIGEIYAAVSDEDFSYAGVKIKNNETAVIRVFHANRDSSESVFKIKFSNMLVNVVETTLASTENKNEDGVMVAYNPSDPNFAAPLGESLSLAPNRSGMRLNSVVALAAIFGALAMVMMVAISVGWRYWQRRRNAE